MKEIVHKGGTISCAYDMSINSFRPLGASSEGKKKRQGGGGLMDGTFTSICEQNSAAGRVGISD